MEVAGLRTRRAGHFYRVRSGTGTGARLPHTYSTPTVCIELALNVTERRIFMSTECKSGCTSGGGRGRPGRHRRLQLVRLAQRCIVSK